MAQVPASAVKYVENLNLQDLKRACIVRGMAFEEVGDKSVLNLQSWFLKNFDNKVNNQLLEEYDLWCEALLKSRGVDETMLSSIFRLSAVAERDSEGTITRRKRIKTVIPKVRKKKARTTEGLFTGTKKAYTYDLAKKGLPKAEVIAKVKEKYPEAKEKSIGIWYNRAKKTNNAKT